MIPALEQIIKRGGQLGVKEVVIGMPHRGRLNVLANFMGKPFAAIFSEFQGNAANPEDVQGSGDVKYHLGTSADREFDGRRVHLSLTANPSHLEAVDPVVHRQGARQAAPARRHESAREVMGLLLHGDAAFAGQGLVAETLDLSELDGYRTGGTIHVIINNQIGFTTSPDRMRAPAPICSDIAKGDPGADLPRQRRRSGGGACMSRAWPPSSASEFKQRRRHRHVLLPPPRPQRERRAGLHPAADVPHDRARTRPRGSSTPSSWSTRAC